MKDNELALCLQFTIEQLKERTPDVIVGNLGYMFELAREAGNKDLLEHGISLANQLIIDSWDKKIQCLYHYNIANAYSYKKQLSSAPNTISFWDDNIKHEIRHLRLAYNLSYAADEMLASKIRVNLGNLFSHVGRWPEAYSLWRESLDIVPDFYMALGNIGKGLRTYAPLLDSWIDQTIYYVSAKCALEKALIVINDDEPYYPLFQGLLNELNSFLLDKLKAVESWEQLNLPLKEIESQTDDERAYRKWITNNGFLLSPLNVIDHSKDVGDTILLPTHIQNKELYPGFYLRLFNQIKQEYATARFLIYEGVVREDIHMSDHGNILAEIDYQTDYSYNIECLKSGFRLLYSIFDKIALFINQYFNMGFSAEEVTFKKLWMKKDKRGNYIIRDSILATQNWPLSGIFWVSRDLFSLDLNIVDPDSEGIPEIRNYLEHKGVSVDCSDWEEQYGVLHISRGMLIAKCGRLLTLTRESIINVSLAVKLNEMRRKNCDNTLSVEYGLMDDSTKT